MKQKDASLSIHNDTGTLQNKFLIVDVTRMKTLFPLYHIVSTDLLYRLEINKTVICTLLISFQPMYTICI